MESKFDRNRSSKLTNLRTACLVFSLSAGMLATMPVMAQQVLPNVANLSADQRTELSKLLKAELQKTIASQKRLPGQVVSPVDVRFDSKTGMVLIELGKGFVPKGDSHISGELGMV
ncbi:hypothetical protein ABQZ69_11925 [Xanthomonas sp. WHRI 8391]|uniref:hypothetical protein n=1 Tax=Xanthomonas TaxID=338 RepID=UPI0020CE0E7C|nr:hypothetical protein [Xanthomonas hortorum]UTS71440.1 hypothetical protein NMB96_12875 [Xanthomonas hortorum]